ncbi:unnamed protein product [Bemisia tabaci]|uniref:Uncharacterized protein n=2 Tax=Bemisia tabaci TaxID=7038 RepID=A0A9P0ACG5_BEMTA|nr:unnamed protein product [Bemisia tabaci]
MANSNKTKKQSLKLKTCRKDHGLATDSNTDSRFLTYCASASSFPPLPPVSNLTAVQRLQRFKAICKKQQFAASNYRKNNCGASGKKSLGVTLIVRKKGVRKSVANTPGKSPFVRSARRKSLKRKSVLYQKNSRVLDLEKMTEVGGSVNEMYTNGNTGFEAALSPENIRELKKEAANIVFLNDRNGEQSTEPCRPRPSMESFVEYPDENGSNASEEIDVVNGKHEVPVGQFPTNRHANGESNGYGAYHSSNGFDNYENGSSDDDDRKTEILGDDRNSCEMTEDVASNEVVETSTVDSIEDSLPKSSPSSVESTDDKNEKQIGESLERSSRDDLQDDSTEFQEDASFDAVLQVAIEDGSSNATIIENVEEEVVLEVKKTPASKKEASKPFTEQAEEDSREMPVLANEHALSEQRMNESMEESDSDSPNLRESFVKSSPEKSTSKTVKEKGRKKKSPKPSPKKQRLSKTPPSPKKTPQKRKASPSRTVKSKSKSKKEVQLSTSSDSPSQILTETQIPAESKSKTLSNDESELRQSVSMDITQDEPAPSRRSSRASRSRKDPAVEAVMSVDEAIAKTRTSSAAAVDPEEPSTSQSPRLRRSQRSFSPSRRMPLRSSRRSGASQRSTSQIVNPTPVSKRKAEPEEDDKGDDSTKRPKTEVFETPRWKFLSSPFKSYWSPQLTNKIHYKQPETPTEQPEQPTNSKNEETPKSPSNSESPNTASSKSWCTIA